MTVFYMDGFDYKPSILYIPLSLPAHMAEAVLHREMRNKNVVSVKVGEFSLEVQYFRIHEDKYSVGF